jgi:hypothetical protein
MNSIPASDLASVVPSVISAGGSALDLIGLALTQNTRVPTGSVLSFPSSGAVSSFFGPTSTEATDAAIYFAGFVGCNVLPGAMLFAQYNLAAVPGYLRGGNISGLTLTQLQAFTGTLTITFAGTPLTSSSINLSSATSFSNAATIIQTAFTSPPFAVTYDSVSGAFVFTSTSTGATETVTYATGTLAADLLLTQATGATLSQGAAAVTSPSAFMAGVVAQTTNWATFFTTFDPDGGSGNTIKLEFSEWANTTEDEFAYVCWDTDITPTESTDAASSLGQLIKAANLSGTILIYEPSDLGQAAFISGAIASIDFTEENGRTTLAGKSQTGITPGVTNQTVADNLRANGYNFYGAWATANQQFQGISRGTISGPFAYIDSYVNQIWMNAQFQLAMMTLLFTVKSIPYNAAGYTLVSAALQDPITAAGDFGAFSPGVELSALEIAEVNEAAGVSIASTLQTQGYYLQILPASAQTRGARTSPPCTFWYVDGGSIQSLNLSSVEAQ